MLMEKIKIFAGDHKIFIGILSIGLIGVITFSILASKNSNGIATTPKEYDYSLLFSLLAVIFGAIVFITVIICVISQSYDSKNELLHTTPGNNRYYPTRALRALVSSETSTTSFDTYQISANIPVNKQIYTPYTPTYTANPEVKFQQTEANRLVNYYNTRSSGVTYY
jgi:hypothetical protein